MLAASLRADSCGNLLPVSRENLQQVVFVLVSTSKNNLLTTCDKLIYGNVPLVTGKKYSNNAVKNCNNIRYIL